MIRITVEAKRDALSIKCDLSDWQHNDDYFSTLHMRAHDIAQAAISCFCFANGAGLTVLLDKFVDPKGKKFPIRGGKIENLAGFCTAFNIHPTYKGNDNFKAMFMLVSSEAPLFMAMSDLIAAITVHHHAAVNCGRAIEGIRNMIGPAGATKKEGWKLMRNALNADENYIRFITQESEGPRHADRNYVTGPRLQRTIESSWVLMNRFLEYRKRGNLPLPKSEFPLLVG